MIDTSMATVQEMHSYLMQLPSSAVTAAATELGWRFARRGRPSAGPMLDLMLRQYPNWLRNVTDTIQRNPDRFLNRPLPAARENPLLADIAEETETPSAASQAVPAQSAPPVDLAPLQGQIDALQGIVGQHALALHALEKRAPVQITIGSITHPPITGQHENFPRMVKWLMLRKHVLLVGPASSGKTSAAAAFAKMLDLPLLAQPLTMDSFGVLGYLTPSGERVETEFTRAWLSGGVFLWDEMSMSAPEALGTLNAALANGFCPIPGVGTVPAHPNFYCIGADNSDRGATMQYSARSLMDGASLDRFIRIEWPISATIEENIAGDSLPALQWLSAVRAVRAFIASRDIQHVGATLRAISAGREALESGAFTRSEILEDTLRKGVLVDSWADILELTEVKRFLQGA